MLGEKKTLPFWRQRRPSFLSLERALAAPARHEHVDGRETGAEQAVIDRKAARRRLEDAKGRIHPPA